MGAGHRLPVGHAPETVMMAMRTGMSERMAASAVSVVGVR
jgi:hypothetical protein